MRLDCVKATSVGRKRGWVIVDQTNGGIVAHDERDESGFAWMAAAIALGEALTEIERMEREMSEQPDWAAIHNCETCRGCELRPGCQTESNFGCQGEERARREGTRACRLCGTPTSQVFNIDFRATPVCQPCVRAIMAQELAARRDETPESAAARTGNTVQPGVLDSLAEMVDMFERHTSGRPGPDDAAARWDRARGFLGPACSVPDLVIELSSGNLPREAQVCCVCRKPAAVPTTIDGQVLCSLCLSQIVRVLLTGR